MSAEEGLVAFVDWDQGFLQDGAGGEECVAVIMPVNEDLAAAQPGDDEGDMEYGDRGRVLDGSVLRPGGMAVRCSVPEG
jgi:hypothetical protein